jgi:glycine/D-amino acid oxidase-like deaminating enzyme
MDNVHNVSVKGPLSFDAIVIGAGIVGAACAKELSDAGMRVAVCEEGDAIGGGATAAGMGHIAVMDDSEAQFALTSYSQKLWHELSRELPAEAEYLPCGSLWVAADADELAEVERKQSFYSTRGVAAEILDSKRLAEAEPNLRAGLAGGLLLPSDSVCYAPSVARYLLERARAEVLLNTRAVRVSEAGIETQDGGSFTAGYTVLATGASVKKLLPEIAVQPRKGHLLITDRYPGFVRHQLIELGYLKSAHSITSDSVAFNAQPRITGQILLGSSRQFGVEESGIEERMLRKMLQRAIEYMPGLAGLSAIRGWTGFRAATPDKLPLIGRCPEFKHVYLATGHEGLGISTSLATARLLVDEILGRPSKICRAPYQAERTFAAHA